MHSTELVGYLFFLLRSITIVISILLIIGATLSLTMRNKANLKNRLIIKNLNKKYNKYKKMLQDECLSKSQRKSAQKACKASNKKSAHQNKNRLFVLNFKGDIHASSVAALSEVINAILLIANPKQDEVLLRLENQGGSIHGHGLAAAQLQRLRDARIRLTVAVDKVAARGGYLMASIANYILASPFAIIGSIGVIVQLPNFYHLLKKKSIDFEQITAGQYKRTISVFGENTKDGRRKMQEELETVHHSFKHCVKVHRPQVDLSQVATGEYWLGDKALSLKLIDEIKLSDDFIMEKIVSHDIYQLDYTLKKSLIARLRQGAETFICHFFNRADDTRTYL